MLYATFQGVRERAKARFAGRHHHDVK
jgi:hypothetical protein